MGLIPHFKRFRAFGAFFRRKVPFARSLFRMLFYTGIQRKFRFIKYFSCVNSTQIPLNVVFCVNLTQIPINAGFPCVNSIQIPLYQVFLCTNSNRIPPYQGFLRVSSSRALIEESFLCFGKRKFVFNEFKAFGSFLRAYSERENSADFL